MKTLEEKIAVMTAALNGAKIERSPYALSSWVTLLKTPTFDWTYYDYRVKVVPKFTKYLCYKVIDGYLVWRDSSEQPPALNVGRIPQLDKEVTE